MPVAREIAETAAPVLHIAEEGLMPSEATQPAVVEVPTPAQAPEATVAAFAIGVVES